ncbi:MAG: glycoside hydrolase family 3 C-terminal domain-containing protein [Polyangiaceae bacterium]|nr:glycoside hydrolase family 3 C-terminal domain-containing protein [Polyangiaceae bacterium]
MAARHPYTDPELSVPERVRDLMERMSIEEMVGQMVQADGRANAEALVRERRVGSFLHILGEKTVELQRLAAETELGIPLIFGIDAIHGHAFWPGSTVFPTQLTLSSSYHPDHLRVMGRITAREMLATGLHWTFSPVLCIARDLRWGRVGETFGEDPYLIGELGRALIEGYQGNDLAHPEAVLACAKHFAGYSETVGGRDASEADLSERKLRTYFLPPFREAVRAGCRTFMTAYQCIDGVACVVNRRLLVEILRDEWGFDGFVVTDWDNVGRTHHQQHLYPSIEAAVPDVVRAGNDMVMVTPAFYDAALAGLRRGSIDRGDIEAACRRILAEKLALGLFDHKRYPDLERAPEVVGSMAHREPLLRAALDSLVLLKNVERDGAPLLPFGAGVRRMAVLGPNADDTLAQLGDWSFGSGQASLSTEGHPRELVTTVLDGLRDRATRGGIAISYARGCDVIDPGESGIAEAAKLAAAADVAVVVVGDRLELVGEERDRSDLELTGGQPALLAAVKATGVPLVVVLINSKPLVIPWLAEHADAILEAYNPGMEGGRAVAEVLFGDHNPSGKLTVSFPRSLGSQPSSYQVVPGWHGSKHGHYDAQPLFPFGFGLSYTTFGYAHLALEQPRVKRGQPVTVSIEVTNQGDRAGTEIAELYLRDLYSTLSTPTKRLRRFARIELRQGETRRLEFTLVDEDLAYVGRDGQPVVEPGEFEVMVGGSSRDEDLLRARFVVEG